VSEATAARPALKLPSDKTIRQAVWSLWTFGMLIAALVYAWKAADSRSAFVRWRHQVLEIANGVNIWDRFYFPNPPILPLMLYPLMVLPPVVGAMIWFALKVGMVTWATITLVKMAQGKSGYRLDGLGIGLLLLLALRPILSDLQHGNINIYILFLVVVALLLWQRGLDLRAGLVLALAIATKVTPALFVPYFLYKRSWRTVAGCLLGLVLFLLVIPSAVLGPQFNWQCLMKWRQNIISPFVEGDMIKSTQEVNQSIPGVLTRLLTQTKDLGPHGNGGTALDLNLASWDPETVALGVKALSVSLILLLALFCRTRATRRDDPRLLGEFALVVLTMLFVSERSWKHHFVTITLPLSYLVYRLSATRLKTSIRILIGAGLAIFALLMLTTSEEVGRLFLDGEGHEYALYFGLYLWSAVVLYVLTAWRVWAERDTSPLGLDHPEHAPSHPFHRPRHAGSSASVHSIS
jgi:hypothetical protein